MIFRVFTKVEVHHLIDEQFKQIKCSQIKKQWTLRCNVNAPIDNVFIHRKMEHLEISEHQLQMKQTINYT